MRNLSWNHKTPPCVDAIKKQENVQKPTKYINALSLIYFLYMFVTVTVVCQNDDRGNYQLFSSYCSIVWTVQIKQDSRFSINHRDDL